MVASFVRKYRATHQRGPQNKRKQSDPKPGVAADFRFLLRATTLVLGKVLTTEVLTNEVLTNEVLTNEVLTNEVLTNEVLTNEVLTNEV